MKSNTKLAVLVALASAGGSFGAFALPLPLPAVQPPTVGLPGVAPKLFPSEQGAFKALEVASQLVESHIVQNGCTARSYPITVAMNAIGSGHAQLDNVTAPGVDIEVKFKSSSSYLGRVYDVLSPGGALGGRQVGAITGRGSFNIGSTIQELSTSWTLDNPVTGQPDPFKGTIIKDYLRLTEPQAIPTTEDNFFENQGELVSTVIDYGYQQVSKKNYVQAKYWQQSQTWRQNGVNPGVYWVKTLVTPAGTDCSIEVKLQSNGVQPSDTINGFNESGTVAVVNGQDLNPAIGPIGPFKQ